MPVTAVTTDPEALTMTLIADFAAPVERLWRAYTEPAQLERFWGPPGWPATFTQFDLTPGGIVRYQMTSPHGEVSRGRWEVLSIDAPHGYEVLDAFADEHGEPIADLPATRMVLAFESTDGGSRVTCTTHLPSVEALDQIVAMGAIEGSTMAANQLDAVLQDLRAYAQGRGTRT